MGLRVAFGRLSRGVHGPGYCTQHLSLFALVRVYEMPRSRFLLQPDNTFYLPGNTFYLPGRHFMVIAHALESTVIHKLHARVFISRDMQTKKAESTRGYSTYKRLNFSEVSMYHWATISIHKRPEMPGLSPKPIFPDFSTFFLVRFVYEWGERVFCCFCSTYRPPCGADWFYIAFEGWMEGGGAN